MKSHISRFLAVLLAFSIAGFSDLAQAQQSTTPAAQNTGQQNTQQQTTPAANTATPAQDQSTTTTAPAQDQNTTPPSQDKTTAPAQDQTAKPAPDATQKGENNASDPNYVPPATDVLPSAPSSTQDAATQNQNPQNKAQQPLGTAAAKEANTVGGAASKPAGTALAGVKQKQSRGLLIKVGAVLAAGAALGTVYAMSRGTSPTPPGAVR